MRTAWCWLLSLVLSVLQRACESQCPNVCSHKGACDVYGSCTCFAGWTGADCSLRSCPSLSWRKLTIFASTGDSLNRFGESLRLTANRIWQGLLPRWYDRCKVNPSTARVFCVGGDHVSAAPLPIFLSNVISSFLTTSLNCKLLPAPNCRALP